MESSSTMQDLGDDQTNMDLNCDETMEEKHHIDSVDELPVARGETDWEYSFDGENDTDEPSPAKKYRVDAIQLATVRRRIFCDSTGPPTKDVFYVGGERIDMSDRKTCVTQAALFARIYNAIVMFSLFNFTGRDIMDRNLAWEATTTTGKMNRLKARGFKDFHIDITSAISHILRGLEGIVHIRPGEIITQLVPLTCTIDHSLKQRLGINGLEVRKVNNAKSLSVNLNVDVKFLYAGTFQKRTIPDKGDKWFVVPVPYMGNYMITAASELYDIIYKRTREYITDFLNRHPRDSTPTVTDIFETSNKESLNPQEDKEMDVLKYLLRAVGHDVHLKKLDLDRTQMFVLTSSMRTEPKYLKPRDAKECTIEKSPRVDDEAVFLSSYTRVRIMEDGTLNFQIYSKACMFTSSCDTFEGQ